MKRINFKILLATVALWCSIVTAQAQTGVFRVKKGIPHLPVVANTAAVLSPLPGALVYSTADSGLRLYTGTGWDSFCSESLPGVTNSAIHFRVVGGIPCLPVQAPLTYATTSGAIAYQTGVGLRINNGTAWKSVSDINNQTNITTNTATAMGNIPGAPGGFTIPVLTTAPTGIENGAFYIDATTGSFKIRNASSWLTLPDCNCPPQADAVRVLTGDGNTFYPVFAYYDKNGDPEGASKIQWYKTPGPSETGRTPCGTANTYTDFTATTSYYISFTVTPVSTAGVLNGTPVTSDYLLVQNCVPQVTGVLLETPDSLIFQASYTYYDKDGNEENASTFEWETAKDGLGTGLNNTGEGTATAFMLPTTAYDYHFVRFSVTPKASSGNSPGTKVTIAWYPIANCEPQVTGISINGTLSSGNTLKAGYIYYDKDEDAEGTTTFQWYRSNNVNGDNPSPIGAATGRSYTLTVSDVGKYIGVDVIPKALTGYSPANPKRSSFYLVN